MQLKHVPLTLGLFFTLIVLSNFLPLSFAQDSRPIVRCAYFLPRDRAPQSDIDAKIDSLIKEVQQFYADQMEVHGFGRKTFQIETDASGKVVVHHLRGRFTHKHYSGLLDWGNIYEEIDGQFDTSTDIYLIAIDIESGVCGRGVSLAGGAGGRSLVRTSGGCFDFGITAHELGHAFGLQHDFSADAYIMSYGGSTRDRLSRCAAEWLDVHRAFNASRPVFKYERIITEVLSSSLAFPPNAIRLRFRVTHPSGLHQVQLLTRTLTGTATGYLEVMNCKALNGSTDKIVEFVTTDLAPGHRSIRLRGIDVHGNISYGEDYPINVTSLLPRARSVSIRDANLAAAVREEIGKAITTHTILNLMQLVANRRKITHLAGLEHASNLTKLYLRSNNISDVSALSELTQLNTLHLNGNNISDVSALPEFTQPTTLDLGGNNISDVSALSNLTQLNTLYLGSNNISDVSVLSDLTQLNTLYLNSNNISDVSALSGLTQLNTLHLGFNNIADVSALSELTQLNRLHLLGNNISDVSALSGLTLLTTLYLRNNNISDVSALSKLTLLKELDLRGNPLSYTSIHTHIPAMPAKGVKVTFDRRAHPVLIKISGDGQVSEVGTILPKRFVVEVINEHGKPAQGVLVTFTVTSGSETLPSTTATTNTKGRGGASLRLTSTPGKNTVLVTAKKIQSSVTFTVHATGPPMYWVDAKAGTLHRSVGNTVETLVPNVRNATSLAVDAAGDKFYWTERVGSRTGKVQRADLDGSNVQLVKDLTSVPLDIAIDTTNRKLYLTNAWGKIQRMNFDGSGFAPNLIIGLDSPEGIAVAAVDGKLYWTEQTGDRTGKVQCADLDGSNVQLVKDLTSVPLDIAIDTTNRKLYLTNAWGKIQRMNFDGSGFAPNLITGLDSPEGIAVDAVNGKLYWAEEGGIGCASLIGENLQNIITDLGDPANIMLGTSLASVAAAPMNIEWAALPNSTALLANYPNPFNPETWIPYQLSEATDVTLTIYSVNGTVVRTLALGHQSAGIYQSRNRAAYWNGKNELGESVASGVYFYTFTAGDYQHTRRMFILK